MVQQFASTRPLIHICRLFCMAQQLFVWCKWFSVERWANIRRYSVEMIYYEMRNNFERSKSIQLSTQRLVGNIAKLATINKKN